MLVECLKGEGRKQSSVLQQTCTPFLFLLVSRSDQLSGDFGSHCFVPPSHLARLLLFKQNHNSISQNLDRPLFQFITSLPNHKNASSPHYHKNNRRHSINEPPLPATTYRTHAQTSRDNYSAPRS